jgi:chorismate dehydratase
LILKIAKIDYINLLPFHIFLKKNLKSPFAKAFINYHKSYPSKINEEFAKRRADMAFISSVTAKKANKTSVGIVARGEVQSVIVLKGADLNDIESASSNALARVLGIHGVVMIGDKALKTYFDSPQKCTDLAKEWHDRYRLPFVFAILCHNDKSKQAHEIAKRFANAHIKIPQTILQKYADSRGVSKLQILAYLKKISYKIDARGWMAYRKFIRLAGKK